MAAHWLAVLVPAHGGQAGFKAQADGRFGMADRKNSISPCRALKKSAGFV